MKIWVDDIRPAPEGYVWCKSVNDVINAIVDTDEQNNKPRMYDMHFSITLIDLDHDAVCYFLDGGDYIEILNYLEET